MTDQVHCAHILVKTQKDAKQLKERVIAGESFGELARQFSTCPSRMQGGDLGWFGRGQMVKPFENAAFNGEIGDLPVVRTEFGWHLIRILEKN